MNIPLYHMVRGHELGVPGANVHIGPLQAEALQDVPYIPWMNQHHCVLLGAPQSSFSPNVERMTDYITDVWLDETGRPISDFCYMDIEGVPDPSNGWQYGYGEIYRDVLRVAESVMHYKGQKSRVFIYWNQHGRFKRDLHPNQLWHGQIDPYQGALPLTCYGAKNKAVPGDWARTTKANMEWTHRMSNWYSEEYCRGRPRVFFVWGFHMNMGFWPLDYWVKYMEHTKSLARDGDVFCWFGAAKYGSSDQHYGPQIDALKELLA